MGINSAHELLLCGVYNYFTMAALMAQQQQHFKLSLVYILPFEASTLLPSPLRTPFCDSHYSIHYIHHGSHQADLWQEGG